MQLSGSSIYAGYQKPYFFQRACFCILTLIIAGVALFKEMYTEAAIIGLIGLTSCIYHLTANRWAELVDMTAVLLTAPVLLYLSIRAGNYIPIFCGAIAGAVFIENRKELCWVKHFYGLHIPAAVAFGSLVLY